MQDGRACVLAHQRLSIIDIPGGHQPQTNEDGSVSLIFNGEIYNFRELRSDLEGRGHRFATRSDTEVIVHLYEEHGLDCVQHLRGMFAFGLWDAHRERLLLARDRLGVKPLYYALPDSGGVDLAFASELKSLMRVPGVDRELDLESLAAYLAYLYIPHPRTAIRGARRLPPAHMLVAERGRVDVRRYWSLNPDRREEPDADRVWQELAEAVELRLVADVPVGSFLSGGLDSSAVVAAMAERDGTPETFTVVFPRPEERLYDERDDARLVAAAFGASHHELEARADAQALLPEIVRHFDEPFGNPTALLVYELARLTRQHVKVALAGDGSDELFAGYPRFRGLAAASPTTHEHGAASVPILQFRARLWLLSSKYMLQQRVSCLRLFRQEVVLAFSFDLASAGSNIPARIAIIAITTSNSINVNAQTRAQCARVEPSSFRRLISKS